MKQFLSIICITFIIISCGKDSSNLIIKGKVKDLKKGTLYLQNIQDTLLVKLDSTEIDASTSEFELKTALDEPEILYLTLDDNSKELRSIPFFAGKGLIEINTSLKQFGVSPEIIGSKYQETLDEYYKVTSRFKNQNLELVEKRLQAQKDNDTITYNKAIKDSENLIKRNYLFSVNFALNNKTSRVAPYIALSEIYDANIKYLDTIYRALPDSISSSKYGKALYDYIKERKTFEDKN